MSTRSWMPARDELRRDDARRAADAAGGVHAHHRLADRAERVGEVQLGHRDALEHVGRLADDDRVDVGVRHARVVERLLRGFAHEARDRHVLARGAVMVCPMPTTATRLPAITCLLPARTPCSAAGTGHSSRAPSPRFASPFADAAAPTSPMRINPALITGFAASATPDGLIVVLPFSPSASARINSS